MSLSLWLRLKPKPDVPHTFDEPKLGMRSPFVLAKVGNDLREDYDELLGQPLPAEIQQVAARLPDAPVLLPFPADPKAEV